MKHNNLVVKIVFAGLGVVLIVYFAITMQNEERYQWTESYSVTSDQPYGTLFIQKLLANYKPGQKFKVNDKEPLHKILDTTQIKTKTDYVFIGQALYFNEGDQKALLNFIAAGNDAFIGVNVMPFDVVDSMFIADCEKNTFLMTHEALSVNLNFYNDVLKSKKGYTYDYHFGKKDLPYYWQILNPEMFCEFTKSVVPLGYIDPDKVNFFRFSYGKGHLYVHSNPLVFTNYFMTQRDKVEYASSVFSHLKSESIIWDEFSKSENLQGNNAPDVNPLAYILQHDSLRYAWWLMLFAAILYTLFRAKRKQRVIPVLEEKKNTSLEFVNLLSGLHFQNGKHHDIARKRMKYFFYFIRTKYNMHIQQLTEVNLKRLTEKSKVALEDLMLIAREFEHIERQHYYHELKLIDLQRALEKFYKHCK